MHDFQYRCFPFVGICPFAPFGPLVGAFFKGGGVTEGGGFHTRVRGTMFVRDGAVTPGPSRKCLDLLESPRTSPEFRGLPRKFFGDFPGSSLTVELDSNPEVPRKFPKRPQKFPRLPRKFPGLPRRSLTPFSGKPDTLSWKGENHP